MKRATRSTSISSKRKRKRLKKYGKAKSNDIRTKVVTERFAGFEYEVLLNKRHDPTVALEMIKLMMPDVMIREQSARRSRINRTSVFMRSENGVMFLKMTHPEIIYKVYRLAIQIKE